MFLEQSYIPCVEFSKNANIMKRKITYLFLLAMISTVVSASGPMYSQYMFNRFLINPADAGSEGYTSINVTAREQWIGIPNSPKTHLISFQTRLLRNSFVSKSSSLRKKFARRSRNGKVGVGAFLYNDMNGPVSRNGLQLTYAYHITMAQNLLSFGLTTKGYQYSIDRSKLKTAQANDDFINTTDFSNFVPDANFGAQYINPFYHVGFSINDLFQSSFKFGEGTMPDAQTRRLYNLTGSYKFEINRFYMLEPDALIKLSENGAFQLDLSGKVYYKEDYWGGMSYRTGTFSNSEAGALIIFGGVRVDKFYFGYAFDYTLSNIMTHTLGSHEFMLSVKFGDNARRYRWLNRY